MFYKQKKNPPTLIDVVLTNSPNDLFCTIHFDCGLSYCHNMLAAVFKEKPKGKGKFQKLWKFSGGIFHSGCPPDSISHSGHFLTWDYQPKSMKSANQKRSKYHSYHMHFTQVGLFKKPRLGVAHFTWRRPKKKKKKKKTTTKKRKLVRKTRSELSSTGL